MGCLGLHLRLCRDKCVFCFRRVEECKIKAREGVTKGMVDSKSEITT
jgi:hypothetical protein